MIVDLDDQEVREAINVLKGAYVEIDSNVLTLEFQGLINSATEWRRTRETIASVLVKLGHKMGTKR